VKVNLTGVEWDKCYLVDGDSENRRKQVVCDLNKYVSNNSVSVDELITINLEDHSSGFEQFIVTAIFPKSKIVKMEYYGGGS